MVPRNFFSIASLMAFFNKMIARTALGAWLFQGRLTRFEVRGVISENLAKQDILIFYAKSKHKIPDLGKTMDTALPCPFGFPKVM